MKRALLLLTWLLLLALPAHADDFDPQSNQWNGLSELQATAAMVHMELKVGQQLDWSSVDERDVLLVLAPLTAPDKAGRASLKRFVDAGGRLIVADDFRQGASWLQPFGIALLPEAGTTASTFEGRAQLPQVTIDPDEDALRTARRWTARTASVTPAQFLAHNLHAPIVLNHPASLRLTGAAETSSVLWGRFEDPGLGWLAETEYGSGRVLALSDPSALINGMLTRLHDNRQFAANLLRYFCVAERPCRVTLLPSLATVTGTFRPRHTTPPALTSSLERLRELLRDLADALRGPLLAPTLLLLVLAALGLPILWLARTPPPLLPPRIEKPRQDSILRETIGVWLAQGEADYRRPARLLASHLERLVAQVEGQPRAAPLAAGQPGPGRRGALAAAAQATGFGGQLRTAAVDDLVLRGHCSAEAGRRLREVFTALHAVAGEDGEDGERIDRARFGQLAAEVEWAQALIQHTRSIE